MRINQTEAQCVKRNEFRIVVGPDTKPCCGKLISPLIQDQSGGVLHFIWPTADIAIDRPQTYDNVAFLGGTNRPKPLQASLRKETGSYIFPKYDCSTQRSSFLDVKFEPRDNTL